MTDDFGSIWEVYGLRTDPFTTSPILVKGGLVLPESFTGRAEEVKRLEKIFRSTGGSRSIVFGRPGVGKTTLVNIVRSKALEKGFFTPFKEIKADADWQVDDFLINTLSAIYASLIKDEKPSLQVRKQIDKLKVILDAYEKEDVGYSATVGIVGGGISKSRTINRPELSADYLTNLFEEVIAALISSGYREVIIHYNNLDSFDEEEEKLKRLFNRIRDVLQTPNVHFVFVGSAITTAVITSLPRVASILTDTPIPLSSLSLVDVKSIVHKRVVGAAIQEMKSVDMTTDEAIETLYHLHTGDLRAILNSLSTAVREVTGEKPIQLTDEVLRSVLYEISQKRFSQKITPTEGEVLMEMLKQGESTNTGLAASLKKKPQNVSKYLATLKDASCIYLIRTDGREKYYSVAEWIRWLSLKPNMPVAEDKKYRNIDLSEYV
ncbi:MAG: AAA family ATPase [Candidatus Micrarchaeia archaeon]|jgi:Cdc6-like AAA superfamily ATPase